MLNLLERDVLLKVCRSRPELESSGAGLHTVALGFWEFFEIFMWLCRGVTVRDHHLSVEKFELFVYFIGALFTP
jgi:hypothetical protein